MTRATTRRPLRPFASLTLVFALGLPVLAVAQGPSGLYPSGCRSEDGPFVQGPRLDAGDRSTIPGAHGGNAPLVCGGPVTSPSGVYRFSGEFVHSTVDLRIRGRGFDFVLGRTYRSRTGVDNGLGVGWDHSYNLKLTEMADGPGEARNLRFTGQTTMEWDPPPGVGPGTPLTYCTLRSTDPSDFSGPSTTILDPEEADTLTDDPAEPQGLFAYLILPKTGTRPGSLGTDSAGTPRTGPGCGLTGPDLVLHDGTGRQDLYLLQPNGKWTSTGFYREIMRNPDGSHTLTFPDTGVWNFLPFDGSPEEGRIDTIADRNQNTMTFTYDALGRLETVTDTLGRTITYVYDSDGRLAAVTDFIGRQVTYDYFPPGSPGGDVDDLLSVTGPPVVGTPNGNDFPPGKTTFYTYNVGLADPALSHNLTAITDPKGQTYLWNTYSSGTNPAGLDYDRVVTQIWGDAGDRIDYTYVAENPTPSNLFAVIRVIENDRVGNVSEYFYNNQNLAVLRVEDTGRAPDPDSPTTDLLNKPVFPLRPAHDPSFFLTLWRYNSDGRATRITFPNGNERVLTYDVLNPERRSQGNLLEHCRKPGPLGGDQTDICESFEYDDGPAGTNFITLHVDGRGSPTTHLYDSAGNRTQTTHRISTIVEDFEYNSFGQLTAHTLPDNGSGHRRRDEHTYYGSGSQAGYRASSILDVGGESLVTGYTYDAVGNILAVTDPKGNDSQFVVNELDQVVQTISRPVGPGGVRYTRNIFYDANDNVVRVDVQNLDDSGTTPSNTHFTTIHEYDILDLRTRRCQEVGTFTAAIPGPPEAPTCTGLPAADFVIEEYQYDANRNPELTRRGEAVNGNQPENVVQILYDERDLVWQMIRGPASPVQSTTAVDYDANGNVVRVTHGLEDTGHVRESLYDGYDRIVQQTDPMGNVTSFTYDANGNTLTERIDGETVDVVGGASNDRLWETTHGYDAMDRLTTIDAAHFETDTQIDVLDGHSIATYGWSGNSQVIERRDDNGNVTTVAYDTVNRPALITDALSNRLELLYDANSNVVTRRSTEESDLGSPDEVYTDAFTYDGLDRLTTQTDTVGNQRRYGYDSRDNLTVEYDALDGGVAGGLGNQTRYEYDGINRRVRTEHVMTDNGTGAGTATGSLILEQEWDDTSRLTSRTDDAGNQTSYTYDGLNRVIAIGYEDGTSKSLSYDAHDALVSFTDANGTTTTHTRDLNDRLTGRTVTPASGIGGTTFETFQHDGLSRVVLAQDDDSTVTRTYDSLSNVLQETLNGQVARFSYDGEGNRTQTVYPGGRVVDFDYDALNRLQTVGTGVVPIADYHYIGPGRVERRTYANGTQLDYEYNGIGSPAGDEGVKNVVRTFHSRAGQTITVDDRIYRWDGMYNKVWMEDETVGGPEIRRSYTYDSRYRLLRTGVLTGAGTELSIRYDLDGVGNRSTVIGGPDHGTYFMEPASVVGDRQMNQYTGTPFDTREYDENGNLLRLDLGPGMVQDVTYDYANRMIEFDDPVNGDVTTYAYDALGRRISRTITNALTADTIHYYYDGWRVLEERDATGSTQATYVHGRDLDEVLTMQRGGADFYYHGDEQHSVVAVTDSAGAVVERYIYEDYGAPTVVDATGMVLAGTAIGNPYQFTGRRYDPETGWYYFRTRYLDPRAARFTTRDTFGLWGDPAALGNTYNYAAANPATHQDPMAERVKVKFPWLRGETKTEGWEEKGYFVADSFSFGVEREMKESGEKGGTGDINIGVGELQECTVSKSMDMASSMLAQFAINGNSADQPRTDPYTSFKFLIEIEGSAAAADKPVCYLRYKLSRAFVKSWSTSGDADDRPTEEVAFYYNKIAFVYARTGDGKPFQVGSLHDADSATYLKYKLSRCFVKSWSTSGDADDAGAIPTEQLSLDFERVRFGRPRPPYFTGRFLSADALVQETHLTLPSTREAARLWWTFTGQTRS